jgi:hypothetical protein
MASTSLQPAPHFRTLRECPNEQRETKGTACDSANNSDSEYHIKYHMRERRRAAKRIEYNKKETSDCLQQIAQSSNKQITSNGQELN